jgi:hypothetical protein
MLKFQNTRIVRSVHRDILPGYAINAEGLALVYVNDNGQAKVRPSTGAAGEKFAGCALSQNIVPNQLTRVDEVVLAGSVSFQLDRPNLVAGQVRVEVAGVALAAVAGVPAAGEFAVDNASGVVSVNAADAGTAAVPVKAQVFYKYLPLVQEAINAIGNGAIGGVTSANYVGVTGIITEGDVSTDQFDMTADWTTATKVFLGPNGLFTTAGNVELRGANIISAPGVSSPFLTLNFGPYSG